MSKYSTPKERVEFGLNTIPPDRMVTVPLRDLMYVHQTLAEFVQFFHQPLHYPNLHAVERFLGARGEEGAFEVLVESVYERFSRMLPSDIFEASDDGERFEHPLPPAYYAPDQDAEFESK